MPPLAVPNLVTQVTPAALFNRRSQRAIGTGICGLTCVYHTPKKVQDNTRRYCRGGGGRCMKLRMTELLVKPVKPRTTRQGFQITLPPDTARKGKALAQRDRRSFSNLLEVLLDRAHQEAT